MKIIFLAVLLVFAGLGLVTAIMAFAKKLDPKMDEFCPQCKKYDK